MPAQVIQRCREELDQCRLPDGTLAHAVCHKVPDRDAWECPNCGRRYDGLHAYAYRDEEGF